MNRQTQNEVRAARRLAEAREVADRSTALLAKIDELVRSTR